MLGVLIKGDDDRTLCIGYDGMPKALSRMFAAQLLCAEGTLFY